MYTPETVEGILCAAAQMHNLTLDEVKEVWDLETLTEDEALAVYGPEKLNSISANAERMGLSWWKDAKKQYLG